MYFGLVFFLGRDIVVKDSESRRPKLNMRKSLPNSRVTLGLHSGGCCCCELLTLTRTSLFHGKGKYSLLLAFKRTQKINVCRTITIVGGEILKGQFEMSLPASRSWGLPRLGRWYSRSPLFL